MTFEQNATSKFGRKKRGGEAVESTQRTSMIKLPSRTGWSAVYLRLGGREGIPANRTTPHGAPHFIFLNPSNFDDTLLLWVKKKNMLLHGGVRFYGSDPRSQSSVQYVKAGLISCFFSCFRYIILVLPTLNYFAHLVQFKATEDIDASQYAKVEHGFPRKPCL